MLSTYGLRKAINRVAMVCIPNVSENISIVSPSNNADTRSIHFGVSNGKSRINKTYIYGFIYPENWILLNINIWARIKTKNLAMFLGKTLITFCRFF